MVTIKKKQDKEIKWYIYDIMYIDGEMRTRLISEDQKYMQTIFAGREPIVEDLYND